MTSSQSIEVLNDAYDFQQTLDEVLRRHDDTPDYAVETDWVPGDPIHEAPQRRHFMDEDTLTSYSVVTTPGGQHVRPMFELQGEYLFHTPGIKNSHRVRCEPCEVWWDNNDPCFNCGADVPMLNPHMFKELSINFDVEEFNYNADAATNSFRALAGTLDEFRPTGFPDTSWFTQMWDRILEQRQSRHHHFMVVGHRQGRSALQRLFFGEEFEGETYLAMDPAQSEEREPYVVVARRRQEDGQIFMTWLDELSDWQESEPDEVEVNGIRMPYNWNQERIIEPPNWRVPGSETPVTIAERQYMNIPVAGLRRRRDE